MSCSKVLVAIVNNPEDMRLVRKTGWYRIPVAGVQKVLHLSDDVEPIAFMPLGYLADQPLMKKRKALSEIVRYESW